MIHKTTDNNGTEYPVADDHFDAKINSEYEQKWRQGLIQKKPELLEERGATHGSRRLQSLIEMAIKEAMRNSREFDMLPFDHQSSLDMIATKISRIIAGDEQCKDHWDDIIGYSQLVTREMK